MGAGFADRKNGDQRVGAVCRDGRAQLPHPEIGFDERATEQGPIGPERGDRVSSILAAATPQEGQDHDDPEVRDGGIDAGHAISDDRMRFGEWHAPSQTLASRLGDHDKLNGPRTFRFAVDDKKREVRRGTERPPW